MFALAGWLVALIGSSLALVSWHQRSARMEAVLRACHELRGPISAARLGLQLGARTGELSAERLRAIDLELGRAGLALEDLTSVGRAAIRVASGFCGHVDVEELLADSAEAWRAAAQAAGGSIELVWSGPPAAVLGDRLRLAQATGNLIANAVEHGGTSVWVRGRPHREGVRIEVIDDGPGLCAPVAQLTRGPRGARAVRGRGLAIASEIVEAHGGRLVVAPTDNGARLVIDLPRVTLREEVETPVG